MIATSQESGAFARADAKGNFRFEASGFRSSTCTLVVTDDSTPIATPTLSGCTPQAPATATVGELGNLFMLTTGCDGTARQVQWTLVAGSLPPGITGPISQGRTAGEVSGVPTAEGTFTFTVRATDAIGATDSETFTITVGPPPPVTITSATLPAATVGRGYGSDLHATGGLPSYSWTVIAGALPPGLHISGIGLNTIGGIPTRAGTYSLTVRATDSRGVSATQALTLTVAAP